MDGKRFDDLTRSLATRQSRRGVLRSLGAGIAAGLGAMGMGTAGAAPGGQGKGKGAQCGGPGKQCKRNAQCCEFAGLICLNGTCNCPVNTCTNGTCHGACPDGKVFNADSCSCECAETPTCNDRQILNTDTCTCDCAPCPEGLLLNGESCACMCPETNSCCSCFIDATDESFCTTDVTHPECEAFCAEGGGTLSSYDNTGVFLFEGCSGGFCGIACRSIFPTFPD
jgi:CXCXC repeat